MDRAPPCYKALLLKEVLYVSFFPKAFQFPFFLKLGHPGNSDLTNQLSDHLVYMLKDQQAEKPTPIPGVSGWHTPIVDGDDSNSRLSTHLTNWGLPAICTLVFPF